jgi:GT2 family glycosyltransferase/glycosyltransferase involved in cell wall biosynthesis
MKFLIVVCDLGAGGVQRGARNFADGLRGQGQQVMVLATSSPPDSSSPQLQGCEVIHVGSATQLPERVVEYAPDVIQVHAHLLRWEVVDWLSAAFPRAAFVEQSIWSRWMPSTGSADLICHQSPWMGSVFRARTRFRPKQLRQHVLTNPVDVQPFENVPAGAGVEFRQHWGIPEGAMVLGRLGQPFADKWHVCLVDSFSALASEFPELFLLVVAPPDSIKRAIQKLPVALRERTCVIDWLDGDDDLARAYATIDIFAHASRRGESFGFVLTEALASSTPAVTLSTPYQDNAQLDWVSESGAGIVAGSPNEFTEALRRLACNAPLRQQMGQLGPPYVARFRVDRICSELIDLLQETPPATCGRLGTRRGGRATQKFEPTLALRAAGLGVPRSLAFALRVRPLLSWTYKGDRLWTETLRWWMEHRVYRPSVLDGPAKFRGTSAPLEDPWAASSGRDSLRAGASASMPRGRKLGVVIPTYHRNDALATTLALLAEQTVVPVEVAIVDNANSASCRELCQDLAGSLPYEVAYLPSPTNSGPAGASSIGIRHFLSSEKQIDWVIRGDDDCPTVDPTFFEQLLNAASQARSRTTRLGGIGGSGAVYNRRTGQLHKPPSHPSGLVSVDYLATNFFPFYSIEAVRAVGGFRDDYFFGYDETEFGLRLRAAGFDLLRYEPAGVTRNAVRPSRRLPAPSWRRYYSLRNQIVLARAYGGPLAAPRLALISIAKPVLGMPGSRKLAVANLRLALRAVADAYASRLGRTVEPEVVDGVLPWVVDSHAGE